MNEAPRQTAAPEPAVGSYARAVFRVGRRASLAPELSLPSHFSDVIRALFPMFSITTLSFDYALPEPLDADATYSVKITRSSADASREGAGDAELSLIVFVEHRVCIRGRAGIRWYPARAGASRVEPHRPFLSPALVAAEGRRSGNLSQVEHHG